jgi:Domain of unknown function (DUF397)
MTTSYRTWRKSSFSNSGECVELAWRKSTFSADTECVELAWRKSSFSADTECVELAYCAARDSKNVSGPILTFEPHQLGEFIVRVKAGRLDR